MSEKAKKSQGHLEFYLEHQISPVHQNISNISTQIERRNSLYRYLGLPRGNISGKKILEVGPASGHNSLYVASCHPSEFDLLEPNPVAVKEMHELYRQFDMPHTKPNIICKTLEVFESDHNYDIVICEAWLGISDHERGLMKKLSGLVKKEGILITTLVSATGFFFNMVRRLIAYQLISSLDTLDEKSNKLLATFSQHLETLKDMSCPHVDWVQDVMLNPGFLSMHPNPEMFLGDIGQSFSIYNSYPRFSTDWRWYKSLYGQNKKINQVFTENYYENIHNFFDYRFVFNQRSKKLNDELERLCFKLRNLVKEFEEGNKRGSFSEAIKVIERVKDNIAGLERCLDKSMDEILFLLKKNQFDIKSVSKMKYLKECFGRELIYVTVIRDN